MRDVLTEMNRVQGKCSGESVEKKKYDVDWSTYIAWRVLVVVVAGLERGTCVVCCRWGASREKFQLTGSKSVKKMERVAI